MKVGNPAQRDEDARGTGICPMKMGASISLHRRKPRKRKFIIIIAPVRPKQRLVAGALLAEEISNCSCGADL